MCLNTWPCQTRYFCQQKCIINDNRFKANGCSITILSTHLDRRRNTTRDVLTITSHLSLPFAALRKSPNTKPFHSLTTSVPSLFSCPFFLFLSLSTVELSSPCQMILRCGISSEVLPSSLCESSCESP